MEIEREEQKLVESLKKIVSLVEKLNDMPTKNGRMNMHFHDERERIKVYSTEIKCMVDDGDFSHLFHNINNNYYDGCDEDDNDYYKNYKTPINNLILTLESFTNSTLSITELTKKNLDGIGESLFHLANNLTNYSSSMGIYPSFINYERIYKLYRSSQTTEKSIQKVLEECKSLYSDYAVKGFVNLYTAERKNQSIKAKYWLWASIVFGGALLLSILLCFIANLVFSLYEKNNYLYIFANEVSFNLVLLAIAIWCSRMYSINRSLEVNYRHRAVSSSALLPFVTAIKNDDKTKNTILLEASRMIFALPETGLTAKNDKLNMKLLETIKDISPINNVNSK